MSRHYEGFSLLEMLITVLLVAVGILGMVAMQGRAIQYTQDSVQRTHAVMLANELLEIVRANPASLETNAEDTPFFSSLPAGATESCLELSETKELVSSQMACWSSKVRMLLPGAADVASHFSSCLSSSPGVCNTDGAVIQIQLAWKAVGESCPRPLVDEEDDQSVCIYSFRTQI